jgi:O-antigen ligase
VVKGAERLTAGGYDANGMAISMGVALLALIGMYLNGHFRGFIATVFVIAMSLPLAVAIVQTGSRSGVVALVLGFMVYLLPYWRSRRKIVAWTLAGVGAAALFYLLISDTSFSRRWEQSYSEGSFAGREKISAYTLEMFLERPLVGWGPVKFREELGNRAGRIWGQLDPHSLYGHLVLEVGLIGAAPFLIGLLLCFRSALKSQRGPLGLLPLAILTTVLVGNMAITMLRSKMCWLVLALAIASAAQVPSRARIRQVYHGIVSRKRTNVGA